MSLTIQKNWNFFTEKVEIGIEPCKEFNNKNYGVPCR